MDGKATLRGQTPTSGADPKSSTYYKAKRLHLTAQGPFSSTVVHSSFTLLTRMTTTIHNLPDELVEGILIHWLRLSPEAFAAQRLGHVVEDDASLYRITYPQQPSLLLVCKRWLNIGSPLLYESVTIRSSGHAATLAQTVSKTPTVARAIKWLAIHGAGPGTPASPSYGRGFGAFLKHIPDIRTLKLDLDFGPREVVSGLCEWLPNLSPSLLILSGPRNKVGREVYSVLVKSIPKWPRLVRLLLLILSMC